MEEVREFKHGCKFCSKSFPCGRSLGGHMRSHLINNSTEAEEKLSRSKLPSLNNGGLSKASKPETSFEAAPPPGYGLRENPKKTWRISDSSEETSCLCKECGKAFQSWKALFGHMKCHSEKERGCSINNNFSQEEQDSWSSDQEKELVFDSNSDNETTTASRKRRSQRRTRYLGAAANSSSFSNLANGSSSVSEIEQEQEEVAMCLMMLSRDVTNWVASKSAAESSDNFSEFSKSKKLNPKTPENFKLDGKKPENSVSGVSKLWSKIDRAEVSIGGFLKKDKILDSKAKLAQESDFGELSSKKYNPSKRKLQFDPELRLKSATKDVAEPEISKISHKRSKFECTTCNKIFHSYQALGGHRASHKKTKGCFASTAESSENSIETEIRPPVPTPETKPIKLYKKENLFDHLNFGDDHDDEKAKRVLEAKIKIVSKKSKGHECPICFKIFSSGQALGGHKRSHLINTSEARTNPAAIVIEKPISEIRDFLDLNLPAPAEEEEEESSNGHGHVASIKPWWVERNEALVGLISN